MNIKETLQLILRKDHDMAIFPELSPILLHSWMYEYVQTYHLSKIKYYSFDAKLVLFEGPPWRSR